jgi:opacity protein-like surface antigen
MGSKKYFLFLSLLTMVLITHAQTSTTSGLEWKDSSLIPANRMAQHNEFLNNQYSFPAKPRSQWELGLKVGSHAILGDFSSKFPGFGYGVHLRKSLGYVVSLRAEFNYGSSKGLYWDEHKDYTPTSAWGTNGYRPGIDRVFLNYKNNSADLSLQAIFNVNNILFHKAQPKTSFYVITGLGIVGYDTKVNALNSSGQRYDFSGIPKVSWKDRKQNYDRLNALFDDTYETEADTDNPDGVKVFGKHALVSATLGVGLAFKLSQKVNLAIEDKATFVTSDFLNGYQGPILPDFFNFLSVGLNINIF